jgi:hypothetical protein
MGRGCGILRPGELAVEEADLAERSALFHNLWDADAKVWSNVSF